HNAAGASSENVPHPVVVLNVVEMNNDVQQEGQVRSAFLSSLGALAIDDRSRRARLASSALAGLDIERVMDALQRAIPIPQHEVGMRRALRRQILRQRLPLAAGREHIEDRVENFADVHLAPTPTAFSRRDRRFDQRPLAVAQIARVARAMAVGSTAVFRLPHSAPLSSDAGAREGITTDSSDSTTFWIGSKTAGSQPIAADRTSTREHSFPWLISSLCWCAVLRAAALGVGGSPAA